jgi:uncharacterized cysteine cluster protein YcgN (CxxCxxCC family)
MEQTVNQFWKTKSLNEMTEAEWESLCDHCGICCLHSVRDGKTGKIKHLSAACRYLDLSTCCCSVYKDRFKIDPNCEKLSPEKLRRIIKLPRTCAYRTIVEGRDLDWWHPLVSGDPATVHEAGVSIKCKVVSGEHLNLDALEYFTS